MQIDIQIKKPQGVLAAGVALAIALLALIFASSASAVYDIAQFDGQVTSGVGGEAFSQAGGHPYAISTEVELNHHTDTDPGDPFGELGGETQVPDEDTRNIVVELPPGLVGNPAGLPRCSPAQLAGGGPGNPGGFGQQPSCPVDSQVGVVTLRTNIENPAHFLWGGTFPVYNLTAPADVPARFGFQVMGNPIMLDAAVRSNADYGLTFTARNIPQALRLWGVNVTFWGVPADPSHDPQRCVFGAFGFIEGCSDEFALSSGSPGAEHAGLPPSAFLTLPTACTAAGVGLPVKLKLDSWQHSGAFHEASFTTHAPPYYPAPVGERGPQLGVTGCDRVPFDPSIDVRPTTSAPDSPSGLDVSLSIPQESLSNPSGIAQSELKKAAVRFPEGIAVNPSSADGLGACSPAQIALSSTEDASCPDSSKIGTVSIDTPLLETSLTGSIFLAKQGDNPFGSLLALYLVAKAPGLILKLPGKIDADPDTGQLTATFDNTPQLPFSNLRLSFKTGPRAPLVTPATCGEKTIASELTGWSGKTVTLSSAYAVDCPAGLGGFLPGFVAGTSNNQAGGFSPFSMTLTRADGQQRLGRIELQLPPGLLGILKSVPLCAEAQAAAGTCGAESLIGHTTVGAGAGSNPFYLGGNVYLTGPYKGAPFGLSIVVPAVAGPFNLGTVVVRASIAVDPHTAQLTIVSDPLPSILQGIPLDLRVVNVTVDRAGFTFNPTNCEALSVLGSATSTEGVTFGGPVPYHAANCAALPFAPKFSASSSAKASRSGGAALDVKVAYPSGAQANIRSVAVKLPKQLPARLSTIQQACPAATFEVNPASCNEGSMVGVGTASTPVFAVPLTGPAYLVSHGGESFPDIVVVLQGEGVTIQLVGNVFISKAGITSATFAHVPDAPIGAFDLSLPMGPHSALSAVGSLCAGALSMPTTIAGQNGAQVKQATKIKVAGCPKAKKKAKKHKKKRKARKGSAGKGR
jgi:hypothetical protein